MVNPEASLCVSTIAPSSRVEEISFRLWELGIAGLQELPLGSDLFAPQEGTEFREPRSSEDWTRDEKLVEGPEVRLKVFLSDSEELFASVKSFLEAEGLPFIGHEKVIPEKYIEEYKKTVRGKSFGNGFWIGPPWVEKAQCKKNFVIDPGMAFGTGEHPTTQMVVEWLDGSIQNFERILDIGTGSGILAIAARRFFPMARIVATDIDLNSQSEVPKNFALNGMLLEGLDLFCGAEANLEALAADQKPFDLVLSNIYGEVLAKMCPTISKATQNGGTWVATGILDGPARQVFEDTAGQFFSIKNYWQRRDEAPHGGHLWLCYELIK